MKKENNKTYNILLDTETAGNLRLIKLADYNTLRQYNSEKFSRILADKIVFINNSTSRINARYNPHIESELNSCNCNNWKIDGLSCCREKQYSFRVDKRADYIVDFENGTVKR